MGPTLQVAQNLNEDLRPYTPIKPREMWVKGEKRERTPVRITPQAFCAICRNFYGSDANSLTKHLQSRVHLTRSEVFHCPIEGCRAFKDKPSELKKHLKSKAHNRTDAKVVRDLKRITSKMFSITLSGYRERGEAQQEDEDEEEVNFSMALPLKRARHEVPSSRSRSREDDLQYKILALPIKFNSLKMYIKDGLNLV
ncbi:unnamed protein product [Orchesella dallaii]|uniref:C2H2-type domain-containing protein n=1 Tax=Orchesella dallaii TaxID=48710 RepID=A0ABP1RNU5_9HEXA